MNSKIKEIRERAQLADGNWSGTINTPFDAILKRPRPSLSSRDHDKYEKIQLHIHDAEFLLHSQKDILYLLDKIEKLELELHHYKFNHKMSKVLECK